LSANQYYLNSFYDFNFNKCYLHHFFNTISYDKIPWITTFEDSIPRYGLASRNWRRFCDNILIHRGLMMIAGKSCKRIIAISQCAANIQKQFVMDNAPELYDEIIQKMEVIHPSQYLIIDSTFQKPLNSIVFTIVGSAFIVKGGQEVLSVFDKIAQKYPAVFLNVVSNFSDATKEELKLCTDIIERNSNIKWYKSLPNQAVLELLKNSHIGLLPTHAETYGYSVLEAQACGCPVISTDIRALSEINNDECGWVINLPQNELGQGMIDGKRVPWGYVPAFTSIIEKKLSEIVEEILADISIIEKKKLKAIERIKTFHDPIRAAQKIENIYNSSI
jgi:glycosyltransferase involved in cell wall biosynthesis